MGLDALILTGQGDIGEVGVSSEFSKGHFHKVLEIIPIQAKTFVCHDLKTSLFFKMTHELEHDFIRHPRPRRF